ncbi:MAG: oxidoreductase, partial [Chloroflexota bacterium]
MLGVGIIGAGTIARAHAQAYARLADCRVVAVAEIDEARGRAFATEFRAE